MKKILLFAATAMLFAACASDEDYAPQVTKNDPQAVAFDTYMSSATRAGQTDVMTTSTLQATGFGVFAYQTTGAYSAAATPNFMYNQEITYSSAVWGYNPLKYWPNNTTNDSYGATMTQSDAVSFFAYAPYVATTAVGTPGITAFTANTVSGDPKVSYTVASKPSESVDLLWGVVPNSWTYTDVAGNPYNNTGGQNLLPLTNMLKPAVDTRMKFLFLHALSRLGINVIAAVDQAAPGGVIDYDETKIVIESVTITDATATPLLAASGDLNLNNTTPGVAKWENLTTSTAFTLTINSSNELENSLLYETDAATSFGKEGVLTAKEKPLIDGGKYLMLIPTEGVTELNVNIVYDVITKDDALVGGYSKVQNNVTKKIGLDFDNGKAYTLKLILGLTSVKLDAEVKPWEIQGATPVDLPRNNE
jgi:hypothetical protein